MTRTATAFAAAILLAVLSASAVLAQAPELSEQEEAAREAAESWLDLVAAGDYDATWAAASQQFQEAVTAEMWAQQGASLSAQLGALQNRTLDSGEYTTELPNVPEGEYVILSYSSAFANLPTAREVVALTLEDGEWKVTGYFVQPA